MSGGAQNKASAEFMQIFEQYRPLLFSIACTILGTVADASAMTEETLQRWLQTSDHTIENARTFLVTTIATLCIEQLQPQESPKTSAIFTEQHKGPVESAMASCSGGSISLTFLIMLNRLTPTERIIFLLRTIYRYEYSQIARAIGKGEAQCQEIGDRVKAYMASSRAGLNFSSSLYVSQM
jgi:RNA polymerase sigma-70 factor, ECF subfamily